MTEPPGDAADLQGASIAEATEVVLAEEDTFTRADARSAVLRVAAGGELSAEAAERAIKSFRDALGLPRHRLLLAGNAIELARERASGLDDIDRVAAALEEFDSRRTSLERHLDNIEAEVDSLAATADGSTLSETGRTLLELEDELDTAVERAGGLLAGVEEFVDWVRRPDRKLEELESDVAQVEELLDLVEETTEAVKTALETGSRDRGEDPPPKLLWLDGVMRARLVELLLDDLLSELADLQTLADRTDATMHGVGSVGTRLEGLESRRQTYLDRLDRLQQPGWPGEFGDVLESFTESLDSRDTPVDWSAVQSELEDHRSRIESRATDAS